MMSDHPDREGSLTWAQMQALRVGPDAPAIQMVDRDRKCSMFNASALNCTGASLSSLSECSSMGDSTGI